MDKYTKAVLTVIALMMSFGSPLAFSDMRAEEFSDGFIALYEQTDPFDKSKRKYRTFFKGYFAFNCSEISMYSKRETLFNSFKFDATVAIKVDEEPVEEQTGTYSSYLFGSDLVTDDEVYSTRMGPYLVSLFKKGSSLQMAGKWSRSGWTSRSIDLTGFTAAYEKVCEY